MSETKVVAELAAKEEAFADHDPERAEVLARARRFKSSWIELAEALTRVRRSEQWRAWGYESFQVYTKKELHLRDETVEKLTGSFAFLQNRAPHVLERDYRETPIPSYQAVDFLRRAESENAPTDTLDALRQRVLEEAAPLPAVSRQFRDQVFPVDEDTLHKREVSGLKNVATRLKQLLADTRTVPRKVASDVAASLEQLLEVLADREEEAA
jgi:hypothetical protein